MARAGVAKNKAAARRGMAGDNDRRRRGQGTAGQFARQFKRD